MAMWLNENKNGLQLLVDTFNAGSNTLILNASPMYHWGEEHPIGWDMLDKVITCIRDEMDRDPKLKKQLLVIKEKWGRIVINTWTDEETAALVSTIILASIVKAGAPSDILSYLDISDELICPQKTVVEGLSPLSIDVGKQLTAADPDLVARYVEIHDVLYNTLGLSTESETYMEFRNMVINQQEKIER